MPFQNKRGGTTLFVAIILAAVILVECTYYQYLLGLDRRYCFVRAVESKVETVLSSYNRELFNTYGIYAFDIEDIDNDSFISVLEESGIYENQILVVEGLYTFDVEDLRKAITNFYSYRSGAIAFNSISSILVGLIESLDSYGIISGLRTLTGSNVASAINSILSGGSQILNPILEGVLESLQSEEGDSRIADYIDVFDDLSQTDVSEVSSQDRVDLSFFASITDSLYNLMDGLNSINDNDFMLKVFATHYASYNFDTRTSNDTSIIGTSFDSIHDENMNDAEYLLTGTDSVISSIMISSYIFYITFLVNIINIVLDTTLMPVIKGIATVIMSVVGILTEGAGLAIPSSVYEILIVLIIGTTRGVIDHHKIMNGEKIGLVDIKGLNMINIG